jgi:hypothetical protein
VTEDPNAPYIHGLGHAHSLVEASEGLVMTIQLFRPGTVSCSFFLIQTSALQTGYRILYISYVCTNSLNSWCKFSGFYSLVCPNAEF